MNKANDSRRKLLKSIATGGGAIFGAKTLPETWKKPVVDSIVLPAHAQTTGTTTATPTAPPGECIIPGDYCTAGLGYVPRKINLTSDGKVTVTTSDGSSESTKLGFENYFLVIFDNGFSVDGWVECNSTEIHGRYAFPCNVPPSSGRDTNIPCTVHTYVAKLGQCP